ncbi:MAG: hypothetical protein LVS60_02435 [Nodosilinea sp. LVE1205-7]|jgi:hypothetical protein
MWASGWAAISWAAWGGLRGVPGSVGAGTTAALGTGVALGDAWGEREQRAEQPLVRRGGALDPRPSA